MRCSRMRLGLAAAGIAAAAACVTGAMTAAAAGSERRVARTTLTMRDGAAGLGRISPRVPHELVTQLRHLQRQIITGKIRVSAPRSSNHG